MPCRSVADPDKAFDAPGRDAAPAHLLARFDERDGLFRPMAGRIPRGVPRRAEEEPG
ncbi:hypothetical protein F8B43_4303 [Methylorubrum populi]|uniref:Uncharacterized protein n=1 Tax=Methylorubrum populi TaxID=223967 RepID=A0A833J2P6_9HYPH|nr:hypothetical protein F8B43_4303 [Methylorubrum populi]